MRMNNLWSWRQLIVLVFVSMLFVVCSNTFAGGKVGLYGIYMVPDGEDAERYSRPGLGGGVHVIAPVPQLLNFLAGTVGFEVTNLLSKTHEYWDIF